VENSDLVAMKRRENNEIENHLSEEGLALIELRKRKKSNILFTSRPFSLLMILEEFLTSLLSLN
jgi:hypothetical protein